ncbi:MAG: PQQ-binding-like beta-propeller repeat protein [Ignavibacteriales bacterium]|nr:PQQ-binding-like beta-propeller repeat protein [Ignavibacteriales bacterium]MCB9209817.1 PQQ-binding-like beta-propeller repeat protein [Ignavibacteriales bacterium]
MKNILFIIIAFTFLSCSKAIVFQKYEKEKDAIKMFGNYSERNFYEKITIDEFLNEVWNSGTHGSYSNTSFIAYDTTLFVSDLSGRITSFSIFSGEETGELKYNGEIEQTAVLNNSQLVFIVNNEKEKFSTLVIYDLLKGDETFTLILKGKFNNEIVVKNEFVFLVSDFGKIFKISKYGQIEWELDLDTEIHSNPAADDKFLYLATLDGKIIKLNLKDGAKRLETKISDGFQSGISIDDKFAYLGSIDGIFFKISKNNGDILWEFDTMTKIVQTPGYDEENIFVGNLNGDLFALDKQTGQEKWCYQSRGLINTSPLIFENIIFQTNLLKTLDIIDKKNGELLNQIEYDSRCRTSPIYFRNRIFIGVDKGEVFCYSFEKKLD